MRDPKITIKQQVLENSSRFEFFDAARKLVMLTGTAPDGPGKKNERKLLFRTAATKSFPGGEVQKIERNDGVIELFTNVIGLFGPTGVLPHTDRDLVTGGEPNPLMRDFLDIFNSRVITLFFHASLANRYDIGLELHRRGIYEDEDSFSMILFSLCGMGLESTRNLQSFPDDVFASLAGHLSRPVRTAHSVGQCLQDQFGVPVKIVEFVPERLFLSPAIRTRLGSRLGAHHQLGSSAVVGESVPAFRQRFEIRIGPLNKSDFTRLCPYDELDRESSQSVPRNVMFCRLVEMTRSILGRPLDFDIRLTVEPDVVSTTQLGASRLGFDSWVCSRPETNVRMDTRKRFQWDKQHD